MITGLIVIFKILFISLIGFHFIHKPHQAKNHNLEGTDQGQVANSNFKTKVKTDLISQIHWNTMFTNWPSL